MTWLSFCALRVDLAIMSPTDRPNHRNDPTAESQPSAATAGGAERFQPPTADQVKLALRKVKDPELNLNIVDLGLVYESRSRAGRAGGHDADVTRVPGRSRRSWATSSAR